MTTTNHHSLASIVYLYPGQLQNGVYFEAVAGCRFMALHLPDVEPSGELAQLDVYLRGEQIATLLFQPVPELLGYPFALILGDELYCFYRLRKQEAAGLVLFPGRVDLAQDRH